MRERSDSLFFTAATCAASSACLFYGAVLTCKAGGASLTIYNHASLGTASLSNRKMVLSMSDATGTIVAFPPIAVGFDSGLFCSMTSGAVGTVFFSKRQ